METKTLIITKVYATDKMKDGTPLIGKKSGKPYWRVGLKCNEYGDQWLNGFLNFNPADWVGQEKELEISEEEWQGKKQLKFQAPNKNAQLESKVRELEKRVEALEVFVIEQGAEKAGEKIADISTPPQAQDDQPPF